MSVTHDHLILKDEKEYIQLPGYKIHGGISRKLL